VARGGHAVYGRAAAHFAAPAGTLADHQRYLADKRIGDSAMGLGRGMLLWLLGIPLPIIILLALFWHH
jgi:hypothetical protein